MEAKLRAQILEACQEMQASGLSGHGTSGNISVRMPGGSMLVTPSGMAYEKMDPADMVLMTFDGKLANGQMTKPSSEWRLHGAIYADRDDVEAIVHTHSLYATILACARKEIPAVHYQLADSGAHQIKCADYATFGTAELSANTVSALSGCQACLLANHGQVAVGNGLTKAMSMAHEVEWFAQLYFNTLQIGPVILDSREMDKNLRLFKNYGQQAVLSKI
jgi:L-fuculose-phosphate aldolase